MFWKKKAEKSEPGAIKLPGPKYMPDMVGGHLVTDYAQNPDWVWKLKAVVRQRPESKDAFDIRIYDDVQAATKNVKVKNYLSFDQHPELVLYEGWFNNESRQMELEAKNTA